MAIRRRFAGAAALTLMGPALLAGLCALSAARPAAATIGFDVTVYLPLTLRDAGRPFADPATPEATTSAAPSASATLAATASVTATVVGTRTATPTGTRTGAPTGTSTGTPTPTGTRTGTSAPTATPSAGTTATEDPTTATTETAEPTAAAWQVRLDYHRSLARLGPVSETSAWSRGAELHSRYMVKHQGISHSEDKASQWFTDEGHEAARNGNVQVGSNIDRTTEAAIDFWMTEPFHQVAMLDPTLVSSGYGEWREAVGTFNYGATLDVMRGRSDTAPRVRYPVYYPGDGTESPLLAYTGNEVPDPLTSCGGYVAPTGPPLVLILGPGTVTPEVTSSSFTDGSGTALAHCRFDQTSYRNGNRGQQDTGRGVLAMRSAVIVMPRQPLDPGSRYTVTVVSGGTTYMWRFTTADEAPLPFTPIPPVDEENEDEVIRLVNDARADAGLAAYNIDARLTQAARRHALDMAANDFAGHVGSDGSTPETRLADAGYAVGLFSTDFAYGWGGDPALLVDYWLGQTGTRAHVLSDKRDVGVGYAANPGGRLQHYWYVYYASKR